MSFIVPLSYTVRFQSSFKQILSIFNLFIHFFIISISTPLKLPIYYWVYMQHILTLTILVVVFISSEKSSARGSLNFTHTTADSPALKVLSGGSVNESETRSWWAASGAGAGAIWAPFGHLLMPARHAHSRVFANESNTNTNTNNECITQLICKISTMQSEQIIAAWMDRIGPGRELRVLLVFGWARPGLITKKYINFAQKGCTIKPITLPASASAQFHSTANGKGCILINNATSRQEAGAERLLGIPTLPPALGFCQRAFDLSSSLHNWPAYGQNRRHGDASSATERSLGRTWVLFQWGTQFELSLKMFAHALC